jgi:hypothetical protein
MCFKSGELLLWCLDNPSPRIVGSCLSLNHIISDVSFSCRYDCLSNLLSVWKLWFSRQSVCKWKSILIAKSPTFQLPRGSCCRAAAFSRFPVCLQPCPNCSSLLLLRGSDLSWDRTMFSCGHAGVVHKQKQSITINAFRPAMVFCYPILWHSPNVWLLVLWFHLHHLLPNRMLPIFRSWLAGSE